MARILSADPRPLRADPFDTGYDMTGQDMLDRLARGTRASDDGWAALADLLDALLATDADTLVNAYSALIRVRDAAVKP